jgi:hypothetical protein
MSVTNLPSPRFVQLAAGSDFDVQVEQEVRVRRPKVFWLPHLPAKGADAPSAWAAMDYE